MGSSNVHGTLKLAGKTIFPFNKSKKLMRKGFKVKDNGIDERISFEIGSKESRSN